MSKWPNHHSVKVNAINTVLVGRLIDLICVYYTFVEIHKWVGCYLDVFVAPGIFPFWILWIKYLVYPEVFFLLFLDIQHFRIMNIAICIVAVLVGVVAAAPAQEGAAYTSEAIRQAQSSRLIPQNAQIQNVSISQWFVIYWLKCVFRSVPIRSCSICFIVIFILFLTVYTNLQIWTRGVEIVSYFFRCIVAIKKFYQKFL